MGIGLTNKIFKWTSVEMIQSPSRIGSMNDSSCHCIVSLHHSCTSFHVYRVVDLEDSLFSIVTCNGPSGYTFRQS